MEDLTSNWLWYGELRPLSAPGARRQRSPERTEAEKTGINAVAVKAAVKCGEQGQWGGSCALMHCVCRNRPDPVFASPQSQVLWVGRIHSTKLQEGIFTSPFPPSPPSLNCFAGFILNLRAGCPRPDWPGWGWAVGEGQATAPFLVLWFCPLDQAGLRLRSEVSSSS